MKTNITSRDVLLLLKSHKLSTPAKHIAEYMGPGVTARAVATAARTLVDNQQVTITFRKGIGFYRFVRLATHKKETA